MVLVVLRVSLRVFYHTLAVTLPPLAVQLQWQMSAPQFEETKTIVKNGKGAQGPKALRWACS